MLSIVFGVGAALVLDEFALLLNLADVYWEPAGRESIDAVVLALGIASLYLLGADSGLRCSGDLNFRLNGTTHADFVADLRPVKPGAASRAGACLRQPLSCSDPRCSPPVISAGRTPTSISS